MTAPVPALADLAARAEELAAAAWTERRATQAVATALRQYRTVTDAADAIRDVIRAPDVQRRALDLLAELAADGENTVTPDA